MPILTNFGKITNFEFAIFEIKIVPNVAYFDLILKKTFSSPMIFHEKKNQIYVTYKRSKLFKNRNFLEIPEIADDHNFRTEYAKNMKFVSKSAVLVTVLYSINNQILAKSGFRPFWK